MKVSFEPNINDYIYIAIKTNKRNPAGNDFWSSTFILWIVANVMGFPITLFLLDYRVAGIILFVINVGVALLLKQFYEKSAYKNHYKSFLENHNHPTEIEISPNGIGCKCDEDTSTISWNNIVEAEETDESIYFFTKCNGIAVRKIAFSSKDEMQQFLNFAKSHVNFNLQVLK